MRLEVQHDSSNQPFIATPTYHNQSIRVTFVGEDMAGYNEDSIRVQRRDESGHLLQGPEIPLTALPGVIAAAVELVRGQRQP